MNKHFALALIIIASAIVVAGGVVGVVLGDSTSQMNLGVLNITPRRPILNYPAPNSTISYAGSTFQITATEPTGGGSYVQYKQVIYQNEACTQVVQTNDETASQTGWSGENASASEAYAAGNATGSAGTFTLQTNLATNTTYWWGAQAYDPDTAGSWGTSTLTRVDNAWTTNANSLPTTLSMFYAVTYNGYIYALGGCASTVYYAPINSGGTVGIWTTNPNNMPASLGSDVAAVAYNGYIYTIGGGVCGPSVNTTTIFYAQINGSSTGPWLTNPNPLPTALEHNSAVVWNGYIYNLGGSTSVGNCANGTTTVLYAQINGSSTGAWQTNPNSLPTTVTCAAAAVYNGYIYVIGDDAIYYSTSSVFYAPINSDHTVGAFQTNPNSLPSAIGDNFAVAYNGYIYLIGGENAASVATSTVLYAAINSTGSVGVWQNAASLPSLNRYGSAVVSNGYAYLMGGNDGTNDTSTVLYSQINQLGSTAAEGWINNSALASSIYLNDALAYNGYIYSTGGTSDGTNGTTTVNYAMLNSNGTLGNWQTTAALPANTVQHGAFAYTNSGGTTLLYTIGGGTTVGAAGNKVNQATVNTNGTLGTWSAAVSANLPANYENSFTGAANGYAYLVGGDNGTNATSAVLYGLISSTGTIKNWSSTNPLPAAVTNQGGIILNNVIYDIGGSTDIAAANITTTVNYAPINSNGSVASWTVSTSLPAPIIQPDVETWNNFIYVIGGSSTVAYGGATTTVLYAVPAGNQSSSGFIDQSSGTLSSWLAATPLPSPLYEEGSAVADGYLYTVGGKNSSGATTTVQNTGLYTSCIAFNSVTNYAPSVSAVSLNGGNALTLTANATTSFSINYSVTDPNGCSNIASVTSTAFRTGVAGACATANPATDNRNCYLSVVNSTSSCAGTNYNETDTVALYYFADSTGITTSSYPTQHWEAYATVLSNSGLTASATSSNVDVNVLSAINVTGATSSVINYGALSQNANTGSVNQTTTVQNAGNSSTTLQIYASQVLTSGTSTIPAAYQHYATSSFTFGGNEQQLTTSTNPAFVPGFVLTVPTSTASVQKLTYWGAGTPAGQAGGSYQGTTMFAAGFSQ